jgi:OmcA/MtrC family decaheme c-type cytochrome
MKLRGLTPRIVVLAMLLLTVGAAGIASTGDDVRQVYSVLEKAFYLSAEDGVWIRPGYNLQIQNITIPDDRRLVVTYRITDNNGVPLDRDGKLTPGTCSSSWILAYIPSNAAKYTAYTVRTQGPTPPTSPIVGAKAIQASSDSGGAYTPMGDGVYQYRFGTVLPADYDKSATHTLGVYGARNLSEWGMSTYYVNELKNWVPNGSAVTKIRDIVPTKACNNCHDPLGLHGGSRQKVELCILCHQPQTIDPDTGNTQDMPVLIHKIHYGPNLPSVKAGKPYIIIGNQQSVNDFSHTTYPQDIRNCQACHQGTTQVDRWTKNPTRDNCGQSCHDNINWTTGEGHVAGPQPSDNLCANCHYPTGEVEYDAGITTAHTEPHRSKQLANPTVEILSVTNMLPDKSPTVTFRIWRKGGIVVDPATLTGTAGRCRLTLAGPTSDYRWYLQEDAAKAKMGENGVSTYTFTGKIPADAKGTYAVESEGRIAVTLNPGTAKQTTYNDPWDNVVKYYAVTGTTVTPRRASIDWANCNKCHDKLMAHGNSRNQIEACVICHNPTLTARVGGSTSTLPNTSVSMQYMIHRIHTGEEASDPYVVGTTSFGEVLYPGDRRDCLQCHKTGTYTVPLPAGTTPVTTPDGYWTPTLPTSAACLGCHDSVEAAAHAYVNTTTFGEACAVCHKESADDAVSKVHAR